MESFHGTITLTGEDVVADADKIRSAILGNEVLWMKMASQPADLRTYYDALVEEVGDVADIAEDYLNEGAPTGERWSEIRYDPEVPAMTAFRYSKDAQPLHTDESYVSAMAGVMLFYCVNAAPEGGETIFVSGRALVEHLRESHPTLLERLLSTPVTYSKAQDRKTCPIISIAGDGHVTVNYNYYCADASNSVEALELNQEFHELLQNGLPQKLILPVALKPGEAVAWHDSKTLHGRNSFKAKNNGDRWIWKTGIVLESLAS